MTNFKMSIESIEKYFTSNSCFTLSFNGTLEYRVSPSQFFPIRKVVKCLVCNLCTDPCDVPLGLQDGRVTPSMLTASSMYNHYYGPWSARLQARNHGSTRGGWIAKYNNRNQWLQIDLGAKSRVKRICTQGRYDANQFVKSYTVSYSQKGDKFVPYTEGRKIRVGYSK